MPEDEDEDGEWGAQGDVFRSTQDDAEADDMSPVAFPQTFEELPIEIRSLTERYSVSYHESIHADRIDFSIRCPQKYTQPRPRQRCSPVCSKTSTPRPKL